MDFLAKSLSDVQRKKLIWRSMWIAILKCLSESFIHLIPPNGTIFILRLLDFLLDVNKIAKKGLMSYISQIFKTFVKPHLIDPNVLFHFSTTVKEADALLLSGSNSKCVKFPDKDVYIINKHACISDVQKLDHEIFKGIDFHVLSDRDKNQGTDGINSYPVRDNGGAVAKTAIGWIILW